MARSGVAFGRSRGSRPAPPPGAFGFRVQGSARRGQPIIKYQYIPRPPVRSARWIGRHYLQPVVVPVCKRIRRRVSLYFSPALSLSLSRGRRRSEHVERRASEITGIRGTAYTIRDCRGISVPIMTAASGSMIIRCVCMRALDGRSALSKRRTMIIDDGEDYPHGAELIIDDRINRGYLEKPTQVRGCARASRNVG